ncbi:hypothetical protein COM32_13150 [Bacillus pseudomycoides]|uniref:hypothetical protein n=1 Tax=Bacillus pseudomycoides TaxID=64104 RepID=UPI000BF480A2|nr:hypothetical protein [Bacillus pseudomycoides]PGD26842.1 hypothetical protein COM32_13150 [Bacillus pseudomycoides]
MSVQIEDTVSTAMKVWKEELSNEQGERERRLKVLNEELKVADQKVKCLLSITGHDQNQEQVLNRMLREYGKKQKQINTEIEKLEKEIAVNEGFNEKLFNRIDIMLNN